MKTTLAILVLLVIAVGTVYTQTAPPAPLTLERPAAIELPAIPQPSPPPLSQPKETTIEQLLDELEKVRAQKLELEKREKSLVLEARKKLDKQLERLNRLGIGPEIPSLPKTDLAPNLVPHVGSAPSLPVPPVVNR